MFKKDDEKENTKDVSNDNNNENKISQNIQILEEKIENQGKTIILLTKQLEEVKSKLNSLQDNNFDKNVPKKVLILYAYYETDVSKNNLIFFLNNALINNDNYYFCININGNSTLDFTDYTKKYNNLRILYFDGKNSFQAYLNIIDKTNIDDYENFIFLKDNIRGPYNLNKLESNWIDYFTNNLNKNIDLIISAYGTSPLGKLYKIPYISMKFMVLNRRCLNLILDNNLFIKFDYDPSFLEKKRENPENMFEIALSHYLLNNSMNYVVLDINGILDLNLNILYRNKNWNKLLEITKNLHINNDKTIANRIYWSTNIMKQLFEAKDKNKLKKLKEKLSISREIPELWKNNLKSDII